jgi:hypothetical protein
MHQVASDFHRSVIGRGTLTFHIYGVTNWVEMGEDEFLTPRLRRDLASQRRAEMALHLFLVRKGRFEHEEVRTGSEGDEIRVVIRVSRQDNGFSVICFDPEGNTLRQMGHWFCDDAITLEIVAFILRVSYMNGEEVRLYPPAVKRPKFLEEGAKPFAPNDGKISMSRFPAIFRSKQKGNKVSHMVRMGVGVKNDVNIMDSHIDLEQSFQSSAPRVNQKGMVLRSNNRGRRAPSEGRDAGTRPQYDEFHATSTGIPFRQIN